MKYVRRKEFRKRRFVQQRNSSNHLSRFGEVNGQKLVSILRKIRKYKKEIMELIEFIIWFIIQLRSLLSTIVKTRLDAATH